jgi:medium-chain acyl-[acyl-carrier-protein] hydrolase
LTPSLDKALVRFAAGLDPDVELVCVGAAGSGAAPFRAWALDLAPRTLVTAVRLAGRESRLAETPSRDMAAIVAEVASALTTRPEPRPPWGLFGFCSGALIAFELVRALEAQGAQPPRLLAVAGEASPRVRSDANTRRTTPWTLDEQLAHAGITVAPAIREHADLMRVLERMLEADFGLVEDYAYREGALSVPIVAFSSVDDHLIPEWAVRAWESETTETFEHVRLPAGHILSEQEWAELGAQVAAELADVCGVRLA